MGCDIHSFVEIKTDGVWRWIYNVVDEPFSWRNYGIFGFLADVRNYSRSPVIAQPRGLPDDVSPELRDTSDNYDFHSHSWLTLAELMTYDYDRTFWNRRVMKLTADGILDGAALAEEGEGRTVSLREFLGDHFFEQLQTLAELGDPEDVRIVFWFDG
jgi:hypothetical protein